MNCLICDIDGTAFEPTPVNRLYGDWEATVRNTPPHPRVDVRTLVQASAMGGLRTVYATARREVLREVTIGSLISLGFPFPFKLLMRPDNATSLAPEVLKHRYLKQLREEKWHPVAWLDDDADVIEMLQANGVNALRVP